MDESLRQRIALFRYSLIAPLVTETFTRLLPESILKMYVPRSMILAGAIRKSLP